MYKQDDFDICFRRTNVSLLPSGCLPLRIRRYVQKSKFDHFSPDSNVVACSYKPFRDRQADRWDISLSDIAVDPICRTSLDSRCKEDPGNRWKNRESRIQAFVVPVSISGEPGISHIISCRNMPGRIYPCHLQRSVSVIQRPILSAQRTF